LFASLPSRPVPEGPRLPKAPPVPVPVVGVFGVRLPVDEPGVSGDNPGVVGELLLGVPLVPAALKKKKGGKTHKTQEHRFFRLTN